MADIDLDQRLRDIQGEYLNFLDDSEDQGIYTQLVQDMINKNESRLMININDLRRKKPERVQSLLNQGVDDITAFQRALKEFVGSADPTYAKKHEEFNVGFEGSFGSKHVTPRSLTARHLGSLVCVEGIVTKCSLVRPKVVRSVHYCPTTKKTTERRYTDLTSFNAYPTTAVYPTKDEDGNLLETEYGLSVYKDHQTLTIQELPEMAPAGQLPRAVDTICDGDLVDQCKPGDRVQMVGIYRCLPGKQGGFTTGTFRTVLIACSIVQMSKEAVPVIFRDDVIKCKKFSKQKVDVFELLAKSLAPSIHGHEYIKKALLCMLLGGVEKVLPNGTRLRGDINILLIGDPSVAKSQLLRYVLHSAPRAIATTGRGASGVGLTAAVTSDHETGDRRLEAGAMVLADRGIVCIDEFDKMSDADRTAIHEVMEQGRVTIAKAGIHARLNARCSVLAAANPVYGRYDQYKTPMENIGLQDSLLSRFDLLFIVLDTADPESDAKIADHVVRIHRYRGAGEQDGDALPMGRADEKFSTNTQKDESEMDTDTPIYEKYDPLLHGNLRSKKDKIVSIAFMRKYIYLAHHLKPILTREAADCIAEEYSRLRSQDNDNTNIVRTQCVTARALETLIRLSTAHAKSRLSKSVDLEDAQAAIQLVQFAYFKKVLEKDKKKKRHLSSDEEEDEVGTQESQTKRRRRKSASQEADSTGEPKKKPGDEGYDVYDFEEDSEGMVGQRKSTRKTQPDSSTGTDSMPTDSESITGTQSPEITTERFSQFKAGLLKVFRSEHANSMHVKKFREFMNREYKDPVFSDSEVNQAFAKMEDANQVMVADDIVFLI